MASEINDTKLTTPKGRTLSPNNVVHRDFCFPCPGQTHANPDDEKM